MCFSCIELPVRKWLLYIKNRFLARDIFVFFKLFCREFYEKHEKEAIGVVKGKKGVILTCKID